MWNKGKLSKEILGLFAITALISVFFYFFLSTTADSIVQSYAYRNDIVFTEIQEWTYGNWIQSISFVAAMFLFVVLFLFLVGQKLSYLGEIIKGIDLLHMHRMDFEIPVEGDNELTELAESINFLAKAERELNQKELEMREEKEALIRALSHDIRTPLTSMLSYSEYMREKDSITPQELQEYMELMQQKALQIKGLTDRLLDGGKRNLEYFEHGKFLMQQLAEEWEAMLEDTFACKTTLEHCPEFSGEFDIQEMRRIFDNLASNVEKYADPEAKVELSIYKEAEKLLIVQKNKRKNGTENVESYKIGLESIRSIAKKYNGDVEVQSGEDEFAITIVFRIL